MFQNYKKFKKASNLLKCKNINYRKILREGENSSEYKGEQAVQGEHGREEDQDW